MDQPASSPNQRPPVPMGAHRRARRRRRLLQCGRLTAIALIVLSILLAIFVHKGLLGIAGLVAAVVVAYAMLRPSWWLWRDDDEDEDDLTARRVR